MVVVINKKEVFEFLKKHENCVLATASRDGKPEAATMGFGIDEALNFYFTTGKSTRKYPNLVVNPQAAIVVGVSGAEATVQVDGRVELAEGEAAVKVREKILADHPDWGSYCPDPSADKTCAYFTVVSTRVCYSDFTKEPPAVEVIQ